ncbi:MAG: SDR family NAD(P)-dependent oxidoreductase [Bryobacteraceae bacterium]
MLENQVVLITGAKGGLGTFVTQAFLDAGANVVGVSRSIQAADFPSPRFTAMPAELARGEIDIAGGVVARFGRIDALVHLMGGFAGGKSVAETDDETLDRMLDLNLRAAFVMARAVIPHMRARGAGRIVAIGSRAADEPGAGVAAYAASKAALHALMKSLALENKDRGISVNVVAPGTMDTPANRAAMPRADFSRWARPQQVAALVLSLASGALSDVSGAVVPIYGREL